MTAKHLNSSQGTDDNPISEAREEPSKPALRIWDRFPSPPSGPKFPGTRTNDEETNPFDDSPRAHLVGRHIPSMELNTRSTRPPIYSTTLGPGLRKFTHSTTIPASRVKKPIPSTKAFGSHYIVCSMARVNVGGQRLGHQTPNKRFPSSLRPGSSKR